MGSISKPILPGYLACVPLSCFPNGNTESIARVKKSMKSLLASVQLLRQHLGCPTVVTHSRLGDKGCTAQIERAIQTLRKQSSTLVHMASERCSLQLPCDHAIWPWSYLHATWLLNRFHNHTTTRTSPFELVYGRRYSGKIASFGEAVWWFTDRVQTQKLVTQFLLKGVLGVKGVLGPRARARPGLQIKAFCARARGPRTPYTPRTSFKGNFVWSKMDPWSVAYKY